jgi:hypothetical protein
VLLSGTVLFASFNLGVVLAKHSQYTDSFYRNFFSSHLIFIMYSIFSYSFCSLSVIFSVESFSFFITFVFLLGYNLICNSLLKSIRIAFYVNNIFLAGFLLANFFPLLALVVACIHDFIF